MTNRERRIGQKMYNFLFPYNIVYSYRRIKGLIVFRAGIDMLYNIQSLYYLPESGISLSIGVVVTPIIKSGLVAYTNEEFRRSRSGGRPCQGDHPIFMEDMGLPGSLMGNAGEGNRFLIPGLPDPTLYQFGLGCIGGLIVIIQHPVKAAVFIKPGVHV